jgi:hypothetical protein
MLWWRRTYFEGGCGEGTALVRELFWPCTVMCPLEQTTFVAKLYQHQGGITGSRGVFTDHLAWVEAGPSPGRRVCSAAVETPSTNPVVQFGCSVIRVDSIDMLLSSVVIIDIMRSTRYLGWDHMRGRRICCSTSTSFVDRVTRFCPWLHTIRGLEEASRLLVISTWALRLGTWIADIAIIRGGEMYTLNRTSSGWGGRRHRRAVQRRGRK